MVQLLVDALACLDPDGLGPRVLPAAECLVILVVLFFCHRQRVEALLPLARWRGASSPAPFFSEPDDISEVGVAENSTGLEKSCSFVFVARSSLHPEQIQKFVMQEEVQARAEGAILYARSEEAFLLTSH